MMEFNISLFDLIYAAVVFGLGGFVSVTIASAFNLTQRHAVFLYAYHSIFCVIYFVLSFYGPADATTYYSRSLEEHDFSGLGTPAIYFITRILSIHFQMSYFTSFFVFNIAGAVGLLAFFASLRVVTAGKPIIYRRLAWFVVLLPSLSFWSSAIGKDALSFLAIALAIWASLEMRRRLWLMAFAIFIMAVARPHMAGIMIIALALSMAFDPGYRVSTRMILALITLPTALVLVPFALTYSGLGMDVGFADVVDYVEQRQGYNLSETAGVDIASMNFPIQVWSYLFRPFPWEARSALQLIASFENMLYLNLLLFGVVELVRRRSSSHRLAGAFLLLYVTGSLIVLAPITANLGIAARQKWMFVPCLLVLALAWMGRSSRRQFQLPIGHRSNHPPFASPSQTQASPQSHRSLPRSLPQAEN